MSGRNKRFAPKTRAHKVLLFAVLTLTAIGMLYRGVLRPYLEESRPEADEGPPVVTEKQEAQVLRVIDGDTIQVLWRNRRERVRLLRIDTPERGQTGYQEATEALELLVGGNTVALVFEKQGHPERDRHGRLLSYVLVDGKNANVEMVRLGWTRFWTRFGRGRLADEFIEAERAAQTTAAGLWRNNGLGWQ